MPAIDTHNYQSFILDYYEGNLNAGQQAALLLFLESHPDLKAEFENFEILNLTPDKRETLPDRDHLLRQQVTTGNLDHYMVARLEGDLTADEEAGLQSFLDAHPEFQNDVHLYNMVKLEPDHEAFPGKRGIKRPVPLNEHKSKGNYVLYAAASVILLIGTYFLLPIDLIHQETLVDHSPKSSSPEFPVTSPGRTPDESPEVKTGDRVSPGTEKEKAAPAIRDSNPTPATRQPGVVQQAPSLAQSKEDASAPVESATPAAQEPPAAGTRFNTEQIKELLAEEIANDPAAFSASQFDHFLDRVIDSDSMPSSIAMEKPVFKNENPEAEPQKKNTTPLLDALAWGASKVSQDVKLQKNFDHKGELVAYRFEAGPLRFGKKGK